MSDNDIKINDSLELYTNVDKIFAKLIKVPDTAKWDFHSGMTAGMLFLSCLKYRMHKDKKDKMLKLEAKHAKQFIKKTMQDLVEIHGFKDKDLKELFEIMHINPEDLK